MEIGLKCKSVVQECCTFKVSIFISHRTCFWMFAKTRIGDFPILTFAFCLWKFQYLWKCIQLNASHPCPSPNNDYDIQFCKSIQILISFGFCFWSIWDSLNFYSHLSYLLWSIEIFDFFLKIFIIFYNSPLKLSYPNR